MNVFSRGQAKQAAARRNGATLVELLVTTLIIVTMAVSLGAAIGAAVALDQNYREESAVRTALALQMEYAERYFSLATNAVGGAAVYRLETGGVSFESNHWTRVSSVAMTTNQGKMNFRIESTDERHNPSEIKAISPFGLLRIASATNVEARLEGSGKFRRLVLQAIYPVRTRNGTELRTNTVDRPIRLWNMP